MPMRAASPAPQSASWHAPILVVDDDDDIRVSVRLILTEDGYPTVAEATTMTNAAAYLSTASVAHVVLLDFRNPHGDADLLLHLVQRQVALQRHRYILTPASRITRFSEEAQQLISAICTEVVYKPFDVADILVAVQRAAAQLPTDEGAPNREHL
jgi:DNA-binding NtrC family response regulator